MQELVNCEEEKGASGMGLRHQAGPKPTDEKSPYPLRGMLHDEARRYLGCNYDKADASRRTHGKEMAPNTVLHAIMVFVALRHICIVLMVL